MPLFPQYIPTPEFFRKQRHIEELMEDRETVLQLMDLLGIDDSPVLGIVQHHINKSVSDLRQANG